MYDTLEQIGPEQVSVLITMETVCVHCTVQCGDHLWREVEDTLHGST